MQALDRRVQVSEETASDVGADAADEEEAVVGGTDYFSLLGLHFDPSAPPSAQQVAQAYRRAAKRYHPDRNPASPATAKRHFERIYRAYETLRNAETRNAYESWLLRQRSGADFSYRVAPERRRTYLSMRSRRRLQFRRELEAREQRTSACYRNRKQEKNVESLGPLSTNRQSASSRDAPATES